MRKFLKTVIGVSVIGLLLASLGFLTFTPTASAQAVATPQIAAGASHTIDRKSTRLNSSHIPLSRMPSSA